jgi:hypothetical protein
LTGCCICQVGETLVEERGAYTRGTKDPVIPDAKQMPPPHKTTQEYSEIPIAANSMQWKYENKTTASITHPVTASKKSASHP